MSAFWQTVIPAVLTALVAGRAAWTRTSRLRRTIDANLALLGWQPGDLGWSRSNAHVWSRRSGAPLGPR
jgi:hypothetical protein